MKKQLLLVTSALVLSSMATLASASSYTVTTSDGASCSQNEESNGQIEFGTDLNTINQQGTVFAKWVFKLGQDKMTKIDCNRLFVNEATMQELELERLQLEIQALKYQLANPTAGTPPASGDDW